MVNQFEQSGRERKARLLAEVIRSSGATLDAIYDSQATRDDLVRRAAIRDPSDPTWVMALDLAGL